MNRFNLTFSGEILEGHDPEVAKAGMAKVLEIDDPALLQRCFSGDQVVLRRDLERREAAGLYARLRRLGVHAELVKIGGRGELHGGEKNSSPTPKQAEAVQTEKSAKPMEPAETREQAAKKAAEARRADRAAQKRLEAEEAAQLEAKEKALKKALKAREREAAKRDKATERARQKTLAREAQHRAKLEAAKQKAAQEEAKALASARQAAEKAEHVRKAAEEARKRAQEQARARAEREEQLAQRRAMEEQAIARAAVELAQKTALKPVGPRVRTRLETPSRRHGPAGGTRRRRQPGAPNLYSLTPFRNTPEIRARPEQARRIMQMAFTVSAIACGLALLLAALLFTLPNAVPVTGAADIAVNPREQPLLLAGDHLFLHDRAGVSVMQLALTELGAAALHAPMAFDNNGKLLAAGVLAAANNQAQTPPQLLLCDLEIPACEPFPGQAGATSVSALAVHPLDGTLFVADSVNGELLKFGPDGELLARAALDLPASPILRLDSGLLFTNSPAGPDIRVFRYENEAFGQQLDQFVLLPPGADSPTFARVVDFLWNGDHWWVLLEHTGEDASRLYRFDANWQFVDSLALAKGSRPTQLASWGNRVIITDPSRIPIQRFSSAGVAEAPLVSAALLELAEGQAHRANLVLLGWRSALALCLLAAVASFCVGILHRARSQVYRSCRGRGAEPIDEFDDAIDWVELAPERSSGLRKTGITCAVLALGLILGAIGMGASSLQLAALLLALTGPAVALLLLQRSDPGHIGTRDRELLLVDHQGMYHLGSGSRIHWRGPFLMIDDVTVFTGAPLLPAFAPASIARQVVPAAREGIKVDRKIVTVKLLQGRHPLALGALAILASIAAAVVLLSLQGIF